MKKEDFKVGQTAYVYLIGNAARGKNTDEERIEEWEVVSIGRKYITAKKKGSDFGEERFDSKNGFLQDARGYCHNYEIYPTKEELLKMLHRKKLRSEISICIDYHSYVFCEMTDEELETVHAILKKYERCEDE